MHGIFIVLLWEEIFFLFFVVVSWYRCLMFSIACMSMAALVSGVVCRHCWKALFALLIRVSSWYANAIVSMALSVACGPEAWNDMTNDCPVVCIVAYAISWYGDAEIYDSQHIRYGRWTDLSTVKSQVAAQCNLKVVNGFVLAYKVVRKLSDGIYSSLHDSAFRYERGKIAKVDNPDMSSLSCTTGLHFGALDYWIYHMDSDCVQIACWIKVSDIITVQEGKIRASRCKVIGD